MTVTTVFSDTNDGWIQSSNASYSSARAGSSLVVTDDEVTLSVGQLIFGVYIVRQIFLAFDTSAITDTDLISDVEFALWLTGDGSTTDFTMRVKDRDWGDPPLQTSDFVPGTSLASVTSVTSLSTSGIGATGAYKAFTGPGAITTIPELKTDEPVRLLVSSSRQQDGNTPTGSEFMDFSAAEETGTTQDPKLTITHAASTSLPPRKSTPMRVWNMRG